MTCKCGSQMRRQSENVFFCVKGDRFVVITGVNVKLGLNEHQWYTKNNG